LSCELVLLVTGTVQVYTSQILSWWIGTVDIDPVKIMVETFYKSFQLDFRYKLYSKLITFFNLWNIFYTNIIINLGSYSVVHGPNGSPTATSEYEHSSIPATVKKLFNLPSSFLTRRDEWAGTFEGILQTRTEPRTDCPS
jgi:hypothetical protein